MPFMNRRASQYFAIREWYMSFAKGSSYLIGLEHITETLKYLAKLQAIRLSFT
jgi:hypothetical protein